MDAALPFVVKLIVGFLVGCAVTKLHIERSRRAEHPKPRCGGEYDLLCEARAIRSELRLTEMDEWLAIQHARIAAGELTLDNMFDPALERERSDRLRAVEAEAMCRMGPKRAAVLAREEARFRH